MNQRFKKGIAVLLAVLLALQAPLALAFACVDHDSKSASVEEPPTVVMNEADCHSKMNKVEATVSNSDCCEDCACPVAMALALTSDSTDLAVWPAPELNSTTRLLLVSPYTDRVLHPPIA